MSSGRPAPSSERGAASVSAQWIHTCTAQRIVFGAGRAADVARILRELGVRRAMLVTTGGRLGSEEGERLVAALGRSLVSTYAGVRPHVPASVAREAVEQAGSDGVEGVVSFGGGSCADAAKAVGYFVEQQAGTPGMSYLDRPGILHVAVPTTYSGAELTASFAITDETTGRKATAGGPTSAPAAVVYDPELTLGLPAELRAGTAMVALSNGIEAAWSPGRTPESQEVAVAGVRRVLAALPGVLGAPGDAESRAKMAVAAMLAGRAVRISGHGPHHGLSQLLGGRTGIPHGTAATLLLTPVVARLAQPGSEEVAVVGSALGEPEDPAGALGRLVESLGMPARLSECGVSESDLEAVARMSQGDPAVSAGPRRLGEDDALAALRAAW